MDGWITRSRNSEWIFFFFGQATFKPDQILRWLAQLRVTVQQKQQRKKQTLLSVTMLVYANLNCMQNYSLLKILIVDDYLTTFIFLHRYEFFLCKFYTTNKLQYVLYKTFQKIRTSSYRMKQKHGCCSQRLEWGRTDFYQLPERRNRESLKNITWKVVQNTLVKERNLTSDRNMETVA